MPSIANCRVLVSQDAIDSGGLRIYTSLDPELQRTAEQATDNLLTQVENKPNYKHPKKSDFTEQSRAAEEQTNYLQGAVVAMDNRTGAIRALVGGRDYRDSKYNRALQAYRQVGSIFKPFVYAAAYGRGMMPGTGIDDSPLRRGEVSAAPNWHPDNSDRENHGILPARNGLIFSRNTMTIRVGELATLDRVISIGAIRRIRSNDSPPSCDLSGRFRIRFKRCYSRLFCLCRTRSTEGALPDRTDRRRRR